MDEPVNLSEEELKLTAALYAAVPGVVEHVQATGKLPNEISTGGRHIAARLLMERRGTDITLSAAERLIYDAIVSEGKLPGGSIRLAKKN